MDDMPASRRAPRRLEVDHLDLLQLSSVDVVSQTFAAQLFLSLRVSDGALDECLSADGVVFPFGDDGKPTFQPSAGWYLSKLDFNNALEYERMDETVRTDGNDLLLCVRFKGVFAEPMEVADFPFDVQALRISICMNTRSDGPLPVNFVMSSRSRAIISSDGMALVANLYEVVPTGVPGCDLFVTTENSGSEGREFPTCQVDTMLRRRPGFVMLNVPLPMGCICFMSGFTFLVPVTQQSTKLSVSLTLVLTASAYKYVVSNMLPAINYLTLIDKYVLACSAFIFLTAFEGAVVGAMATKGGGMYGDAGFITPLDETPEEQDERIRFAVQVDLISFYVAIALFLAIHVWLAWAACYRGYKIHPKIATGRQMLKTLAAKTSSAMTLTKTKTSSAMMA